MQRRSVTEPQRLVAATGAGALVSLAVAWLGPWQLATLSGWSTLAVVMLAGTWLEIGRLDADQTAARATSEDASRSDTRALLLGASVVSLVGVLMALIHAGRSSGADKAVLTGTAIATIVLSWALVHTLFTLRYAHTYFTDGGHGIDFKNPDERPTYLDFAYLAFTVGMTFQVSDTDIQSNRMRHTVLGHALLSYLFGTVIVASTINIVAGLVK